MKPLKGAQMDIFSSRRLELDKRESGFETFQEKESDESSEVVVGGDCAK